MAGAAGWQRWQPHVLPAEQRRPQLCTLLPCCVQVLTVVDVSLTSASPCVHVFPAVLALAKNFQVGCWGRGSSR